MKVTILRKHHTVENVECLELYDPDKDSGYTYPPRTDTVIVNINHFVVARANPDTQVITLKLTTTSSTGIYDLHFYAPTKDQYYEFISKLEEYTLGAPLELRIAELCDRLDEYFDKLEIDREASYEDQQKKVQLMYPSLAKRILATLSDGKVHSCQDLAAQTEDSPEAITKTLTRLSTKHPIFRTPNETTTEDETQWVWIRQE